jgi:hypothetical protein
MPEEQKFNNNIKNVEFEQLQESVNDAIKEGGALMGTIFE